MKKGLFGLSWGEIALWAGSVTAILCAFLLFDRSGVWGLIASLIGVTSLIFYAKGNYIGPILMIVFCLLYGAISFTVAYYGEMITYVGMTLPLTVYTLVAWLRHPFQGKRTEVTVNHLRRKEIARMFALSVPVTAVFAILLAAVHTKNLIPGTVSVTTSFLAVYLTARRSAFYALAYAANDAVLVFLWALMSRENASYLSVTVCFAAFLVNDLYGFFSWRRMSRRQNL